MGGREGGGEPVIQIFYFLSALGFDNRWTCESPFRFTWDEKAWESVIVMKYGLWLSRSHGSILLRIKSVETINWIRLAI